MATLFVGDYLLDSVKYEKFSKIVELTRAEFDALEAKDEDTLYVITDEELKVAVTDDSGKVPVSQLPISTATVTLSASGWTDSLQTVTVTGVSADESKQLITPTPASASLEAYNEAGVMCTAQAENSLTFKASEVPTVDLQVFVVIQEVA